MSSNGNNDERLPYARSVSLDVSKLRGPRTSAVSDCPSAEAMAEEDVRNLNRQTSEPVRNRLNLNMNILSETMASRTSSTKEMVKNTAANFFGVSAENEDVKQRQWQERRLRLLNRKCGKLKPNASQTLRASMPRTPRTPNDVVDGAEAMLYSAEEDNIMADFHKDPVYKLTLRGLNNVTSTLKRKLTTTKKEEAKEKPEETTDEDDDAFESVDDNFFVALEHRDVPGVYGDTPDGHQFRMAPAFGPTQLSYIPPHQTLLTKKGIASETWKVHERKHDDGYIPSSLIETVLDNSVRRVYGIGWVGQLFNRQFKKDLTQEERDAIDHFDDHRPFFTYWMTTVQILIMLIALCAYGFGPFGFTRTQVTGLVLVSSLSLQQVDYYEPDNFWLGPRAADLIHMGAKYTPCMRRDALIYKEIQRERAEEKHTACCIRNDDSGCVQAQKNKCSPLLSTWYKWSPSMPGPITRFSKNARGIRMSGTVCGQDPRYCEEPASQSPYEWPDDLTKWPICRKTKQIRGFIADDKHMSCELIGRPCCIGIHGECKITTQAYCDFAKGVFHEEATLCSQVSCMKDICGMIPFYSDDTPDQFYRLWLSIFLHAGLLHLIPSVVFQWVIMRDIEKSYGSLRIGVIYTLSGIGGNLASAIFVPYRGEVGPAGSQFGLLACLFVEVINSWDLLENPQASICRLSLIASVFFGLGILPWVDNYAHIFGFFIGLLLSLALLPFLTITPYKRKLKKVIIGVTLTLVTVIFVGLFLGLYVFPVYQCDWCKYLNCIPFTDNWCADQDIKITRSDVL